MLLRVVIRVAGETKQSFTYVQLVDDLAMAGAAGSCIVEVGFIDFRMIEVAVDVPDSTLEPADRKMHCELAGAELWAALRDGLGVNPIMMSGRLAVVVRTDDTSEEVQDQLRQLGYRVDLLDALT